MAQRSIALTGEQTIAVRVWRCQCGTPAAHPDALCPQGRWVEYGVVSYDHPNPIRRALGRALVTVRRALRGR